MKLNLQQKKYATEDNFRKIISIITGMMSSVDNVASQCLKDYNPDETYTRGQICLYNNYVWLCKTVTTGAFEETKWEKQADNITELDLDTIKSYLNLSQDQLNSLQNLIDDAQITLTKTHSSSKIYMDIQQCLEDSKTYTLKEIAKMSGASYKVVTTTTEMTDEKIIYLLNNGTTFDMYIVDGAPTKIGDTDIDLSGYLKIAEAENVYLKKADATSTYATKTELGDYSKTSDVNTELDKKVDKTSILTAINGTNTDSQVPSAKAVYDSAIVNKNLKTYTDLSQLGLTEGSETLITIGKAMQDGSTAVLKVALASNTSEYPYTYGELIVFRVDNNRVTFNFYPADAPSSKSYQYICTYHGAKDKLSPWKKVCTTSVEDVPITNIAPADTTTFINFTGNPNCNYCVRNGVCYVTIWDAKISSTGMGIKTGVHLPKAANTRIGVFLTTGGNVNTGAFVYLQSSGELCFDVKEANTSLYGSFSYLIKESK